MNTTKSWTWNYVILNRSCCFGSIHVNMWLLQTYDVAISRQPNFKWCVWFSAGQFYFENTLRNYYFTYLFRLSVLFLGSHTLQFSTNSIFSIETDQKCNDDQRQVPCMLLLCVCWWKRCDVDPKMLLLLLELVELLSGLGVAIAVLDSIVNTEIDLRNPHPCRVWPLGGGVLHLNQI